MANRNAPRTPIKYPVGTVPKASQPKELGITVKQLMKALSKCPPTARVYFLDTDDADRRAAYIDDAQPVPAFIKGLGHDDAEQTTKDAGLRDQHVVLTGVTT